MARQQKSHEPLWPLSKISKFSTGHSVCSYYPSKGIRAFLEPFGLMPFFLTWPCFGCNWSGQAEEGKEKVNVLVAAFPLSFLSIFIKLHLLCYWWKRLVLSLLRWLFDR